MFYKIPLQRTYLFKEGASVFIHIKKDFVDKVFINRKSD